MHAAREQNYDRRSSIITLERSLSLSLSLLAWWCFARYNTNGFVTERERERERGGQKKVYKTLNTKNSLGEKFKIFVSLPPRRRTFLTVKDTRSQTLHQRRQHGWNDGDSREDSSSSSSSSSSFVVQSSKWEREGATDAAEAFPEKQTEGRQKIRRGKHLSNRYKKVRVSSSSSSSSEPSLRGGDRGMEWHGMFVVQSRVD